MDLPRHWRLKQARYRLEGAQCEDCDSIFFPARSICPECRSERVSPYQFAGRGRVYSYSTVYQPPAGFDEYVPYTVALVRLDEGPLVATQLTDIDPSDVEIDMPVEMVTRTLRRYGDDGPIVYGYKFRPVLEAA
ncbi:MAG: Zn-ribbon domain-containing OB-fold protein [Anaerolineae bacterium]